MKTTEFLESDLYEPIKNYFLSLHYKVHSEVNDCDVVANKDDELIIVELKKSFNLKLVYQAINRLALTDQVYVAIPRQKKINTKEYKSMLELVRRLEIGLITVAMDSPTKVVDVVVYPEALAAKRINANRKRSLLKEMNGRLMDLNKGGTNNTKINTAYREKCVKLACILLCRGQKKPKELVLDYGFEKNISLALNRNVYGWFEKIEKGLYGISESGQVALTNPDRLMEYYLRLYKE